MRGIFFFINFLHVFLDALQLVHITAHNSRQHCDILYGHIFNSAVRSL
jgi:maltodextrin utilization protein YvdJ